MNPRQPINENVQNVALQEGWWSTNRPVLEASLARILKHIEGEGAGGPSGHFAILTSWRKLDDEERPPVAKELDAKLGTAETYKQSNRDNFKQLVRAIRSNHLGCIRLTGSWLDDTSNPNAHFIERSLLIPGKTDDDSSSPLDKDLAISLGKQYNQDSVIYCGPDIKNQCVMYSFDRENGEFKPDRTFSKTVVLTGAELEKSLNDQKNRIVTARETKVQPPDFQFAGASQPGTKFVKGKPAIDPTRKSFRFAESIFESVGQPPCSFGVRLLTDNPWPYGHEHNMQVLQFLRHDLLAPLGDFRRFRGGGCRIPYDPANPDF